MCQIQVKYIPNVSKFCHLCFKKPHPNNHFLTPIQVNLPTNHSYNVHSCPLLSPHHTWNRLILKKKKKKKVNLILLNSCCDLYPWVKFRSQLFMIIFVLHNLSSVTFQTSPPTTICLFTKIIAFHLVLGACEHIPISVFWFYIIVCSS